MAFWSSGDCSHFRSILHRVLHSLLTERLQNCREEGIKMDDISSWIDELVARKEYSFFCAVPHEYINDNFNLCGLRAVTPRYSSLLNLIVGPPGPITSEAVTLYGLIHARYILTTMGLSSMVRDLLSFYSVFLFL